MGIIGFLKTIFSIGQQRNTQEVDETFMTEFNTMPAQSSLVKRPGPLDHVTEDFLNKNCESLDAFIISEEMNHFDLLKLAQLNGINLQMRSGWYPLLKKLVIELHQAGWDKRVSCIKEKYAELRFHTPGFDEIIDRYTEESKTVCETCGERGKIRTQGGWDFGACRKHYIETRSEIVITEEGFIHDGKPYYWKDAVSAGFADETNYYGDYHLFKITFNENIKVSHSGWDDNVLYIRGHDYGWGAMMAAVSGRFSNMDEAYLAKFNNPLHCKTCGYLAAYNNKCECCEERIYNEKDHSHYDDGQDYYRHQQLYWYDDEGELYEAMAPHYAKSPDYVKLVNEEDVEQHRKDMKTLYD